MEENRILVLLDELKNLSTYNENISFEELAEIYECLEKIRSIVKK